MTKELLSTKLDLESKNSSILSLADFPTPPATGGGTIDPSAESSAMHKTSLNDFSSLAPSSNRTSQSDDHGSSRSFFSFNLRKRKPIKSRSSLSQNSFDGTTTTSTNTKQQLCPPSLGKHSCDDPTIDSITSASDVEKSPRNSISKDVKDLTSETSSVEDPHHHHYRHLQQQPALMSNNDIARISKALTGSDHNNENTSVAVPANMNPVSRLLEYTEATSEACENLGRAVVQNVDSTSIHAFLDTFLKQHPPFLLENSKKGNLSPSSSLSSSLSLSLSSSLSPNSHHHLDYSWNEISPSSTMIPGIQTNIHAIPPRRSDSTTTSTTRREGTVLTKLKPSDRQQQDDYIKSATSTTPISTSSSLEIDRSKVTLDLSTSMRRKNSIKELMQTETKYLDDLRVLVTHFFEIIKDARCISREHRKVIIRNGEAILRFQEKFAEALQYAHGYDHDKHQLSATPNVKKIAQCFIQWGPRFDVYMDYCVGQDKAVEVYRHLLETNDAFSNLMERTHSFLRVSLGFGLGSKLTFDDYLITPFQRVFRYRLMLQSISKTSKVGSDEKLDLIKAQDVMHDIATRLNTTKSRLEAEKKTNIFLTRLKSDWTIPRRWHSTLGPCVLIGTLEVRQVKDGRKPKRYGCALFGTYMIIVKAKKGKNYYEPRHWFPIRMFDLENIDDIDGSMSHAWKLYNEQHTIEFGAMCEQEKHIWMEELRKAIDESKAQYDTQLWDAQNRGNVIEQLFVSSFDQIESKSQEPSPSSNVSSVSSLQSMLSRQDSFTTSNKKATTRVSKFLFTHQQHSNSNNNHYHYQSGSFSTTGPTLEDDIPQCSTPSSITATTTTTTTADAAAVATMYPNLQHMTNNTNQQQQQQQQSRHWKAPMLPIDTNLPPSSSGSQSSFLRQSQSSVNDLREFFHSNVAGKWSQRKYTQYQSRCIAVDAKFEDVSTTPILTARSQARQDRKGSFEQWRRRSTLVDDPYYTPSQSSSFGYFGTPRSSGTSRHG
ncbi:hypothetical protein BCR42DRAFT_490281 [Absidia repens]|uniref:DH domain-containing protein n=1 Tax=Absidia repens TaxID=90262 RepID=A0A1X2IMJ4_9FUNG|nr:hypothetical protein BCR42DRAFT_490281 [Absidia repens]